MYGMHAFVCFRLGEKATLIAGASLWPPPILRRRVFTCSRVPLGHEKLDAKRGEMGGERGSQGRKECQR